MNQDRLQFWNQVLARYGFRSNLILPDQLAAYSRINVDLGRDYRDRPLTMEIKLDSYLIPAELKVIEDKGKKTEEEQIFQLFVALPFFVEPQMISETARIILMLNKSLELPGLGLDEVTRLVYFRHSLLTKKGQLSPRLLIAVVGMIHFIVDSLMLQIESVAKGSTVKDVLTTYANQLIARAEELELRKAS